MTNQPLVSICIPTYNAGEFFEACLQSALEQTYPNIEILISDDGSTDGTLQIVDRYQRQHPVIRLVENANRGMVSNWNNCITKAKGEWVKFLFQDDILKPGCVEKMLEACLANHVEVGLCRREFIIHNDVPKPLRFDFKYKLVRPERVFGESSYISPEQLAKGIAEHMRQNILGEPTCYLFSKRIFEQTGMFNPEFKQVVDLEFIIRLGLKKGLAFSPEVLALFRVHGKSESSANIKEDKTAEARNITAVTGDIILLFYHFKNNPEFDLVMKAIGEDVLEIHMRHMYYSGCKKKGQRIFNQALKPIREKYPELGNMHYNIFKYAYYRKLFKKWEKHNRLYD